MKAILTDKCRIIFLTDDEVKKHCKPGAGADTCSWLLLGRNGWECCCLQKPKVLLKKRESGDMIAMRDGCKKVNDFNHLKHYIGTYEF